METKRSFWWWVLVGIVSTLAATGILELTDELGAVGAFLAKDVEVPIWLIITLFIAVSLLGDLLFATVAQSRAKMEEVQIRMADPPAAPAEPEPQLPAIGELDTEERWILTLLIEQDGGRIMRDEFSYLIDSPRLTVESALDSLEDVGYIERYSAIGGPTEYGLSARGRDRLIEVGEI